MYVAAMQSSRPSTYAFMYVISAEAPMRTRTLPARTSGTGTSLNCKGPPSRSIRHALLMENHRSHPCAHERTSLSYLGQCCPLPPREGRPYTRSSASFCGDGARRFLLWTWASSRAGDAGLQGCVAKRSPSSLAFRSTGTSDSNRGETHRPPKRPIRYVAPDVHLTRGAEALPRWAEDALCAGGLPRDLRFFGHTTSPMPRTRLATHRSTRSSTS